jgi:hypothetical protein
MEESNNLNPTVDAGAIDSTGPVATPDALPSFTGKSSDEIAAYLAKANQPAVGQDKQQLNPELNPNGQPAKQANDIQVPDKFKNPDGSVNLPNLVKSYSEAEKLVGKYNNTAYENQQLKAEMESLRGMIEEFKQTQLNQPPEQAKPETEYTDEEIEMIQKNPKAWLNQNIEKILENRTRQDALKQQEQRIKDYEMLTAINKARETLPEFKALEPEMKKYVDMGLVEQDPRSIELIYNAVLGSKIPQIVDVVKKSAFDEGYAKARAELKLQVEGGGKDTSPVGNVDVNKLTASDLEKLLPRADNEYQRY